MKAVELQDVPKAVLGIFLFAAVAAVVFFLLRHFWPYLGDTRGGLLIPLYVYPESWEKEKSDNVYNIVKNVSSHVPMVIVINPDNGDGALAQPNEDYKWAVQTLKDKRTVGYIRTNWGQTPIEDVKARVDGYLNNEWGVSGFFFDETSSALSEDQTANEQQVEHYKAIRDYVKSKGKAYLTIFNTGTKTSEAMASLADITVSFEQTSAVFDAEAAAHDDTEKDKKKWAAIVYGVGTAQDAIKRMEEMKDKHYYWKYVLEDNTYNHLPSYFNSLVEWLQKG